MERVYYSINEAAAKTAHNMMSFSDYQEGSKTVEYQRYVDKAYDMADKVAEAMPDKAERVYKLAERYSRKMAENLNNASRIGMMCPSVMISGSGNFPVKKKEKQNAAMDKNYEKFNEIQGILRKIEAILHGKSIIKSDDEKAIEKLEEKLEELKEMQAAMKSANKAVRLKDTDKGNEMLMDMGYSEKQIKELRTPDFCGRIGFASYALQNNNANIHRIEGRIKELKATKEKGTQEEDCKFCKIVRNVEDMRLQLIFDGKPEPEVRDVLKRNGFRWAPSNQAWQRHLNGNSEYSLKRVIEDLEKVEGEQA
jgi:hypothetical protein